ncbi:MAG: hypothetical protein LBB21_02810, partial [Holosporaceae bacterium]|nr:hypothetical protein [Holosporaceae bacterium]
FCLDNFDTSDQRRVPVIPKTSLEDALEKLPIFQLYYCGIKMNKIFDEECNINFDSEWIGDLHSGDSFFYNEIDDVFLSGENIEQNRLLFKKNMKAFGLVVSRDEVPVDDLKRSIARPKTMAHARPKTMAQTSSKKPA